MHRLYWVVGAALCLGIASTPVHADPPKGFAVPPDIQAILDKKKRHEALTMDDIKKLQDWAAGIQAHLPTPPLPPGTPGAPAAGADAAPIPVRFELTAHYTRTQGSTTQTFDIAESAPLALIAKINGTDDFVKGVLDPSAKVSSFLFQPASGRGAGHYRMHATQSRGTRDFDSAMSDVTGGLMLVTVGGDTLGIIPGQLLGEVDSTYHDVEDGKPITRHLKGAVEESLVDLLFPWEAHVTKDRTKPVPNPRAKISYSALVAAIQSGKPTPIKIDEPFDWNDHGEKVSGSVQLTITVKPAPLPRLEARIVPVSDWDNWKPEGPTPRRKHGNTFTVKIVLYDTETNAPWKGAAKVDRLTMSLDEVTHLPGVCTNWPAKGDEDYEEKPDLFFSEANKFGSSKDAERQSYELGATEWFQPVDIESRDFASWGRLTAQVNIAGGVPLIATFKPRDTVYLQIPRDDDNNKISDGWKPGLNLDAAADDEDAPAWRDKGDGFTVMEEYRGFMVSPGRKRIPADDEDQRRLDPKIRELLVVLEVDRGKEETLVRKGLEIFESAAQIQVYALAEQPRGRPYPGDNGRPRAVVFNATPVGSKAAAESMNTLGVWITSSVLRPDSVARAWPKDDHRRYFCSDHPKECVYAPASLRYVAIGSFASSVDTVNQMIALVDPDPTPGGPNTQKRKQAVDAYLRAEGVTDAQRRAAVKAARAHVPELADEMTGFSIAHELGHSLGAQHHGTFENDPKISTAEGPENCPMRYWQALNEHTEEGKDAKGKSVENFVDFPISPANTKLWMRYFTGDWNPLVSGPSGPWKICDDNVSQMGHKP